MKRTHSWLVLAATLAALVAGVPAAHARGRALGVDVWTDRGDDAVYSPGEAMQVKVRATDDAYLLVYEIDAEGHISVLYPWRRTGAVVEGHRTYRLPPSDSPYELVVDQTVGQGFLVAIASREPFRDLPWYLRPFDPQGEVMGYEDQRLEEEGFDEEGAVVGDPMVAMERIRRRVLQHAGDTDLFATSYATYYVGHEVRYPRYLCSDCHRRGQWAWWDGFDPYYTRCSVFDFRVNWGWNWGPSCWSGHVPYYYYVVRSDCPPQWQHWYDDRSRWSSWDNHRERENLWGGPPTRYKKERNDVGPVQKPWSPVGGGTPPGYLPPGSVKSPGERRPLPVGRMDRPSDGSGSGSVDRGRKGDLPNGSVGREPRKPTQPGDWTPRESDRGRREPEAAPPRQERRADPPPAEKPRREERAPDPPRNDPPKQERRSDPPPAQAPAPPPPPAKPSHERGDRKGDK
ncbi:MAG: DUF4384 domain-containing protein [Candidatus Eisenbacteria bacterium]|uniref:DUF4384 domain-containing protein n=1 Tax=Eiseniibacteriota bacterium TaxID=2212470 RepID=A0A933SGC6_UNCEI|nr:DUF4384 domain-containing protein [Candidatus Eisenbacteria bacterium]